MKSVNISFQVLFSFCTLVCVVVSHKNSYWNFDENEDNENNVDPHSLFYDNSNNKMIQSIDSQRASHATEIGKHSNCGQDEKAHDENEHAALFYRRLVNMILLNMSIKEDGHLISGTLYIEAFPSQMEALRGIQDQKLSIKEIDAILSDIIRKPETDAMFIIRPLYSILLEYWYAYSAVGLIILTYKLFRSVTFSRRLLIFLTIDLIIVGSFLISWYQLVKAAEYKLLAAQTKFKEMPLSCQPDKMNMWQTIKSYFSYKDNECEEYYKALFANPMLEVTPAQVLSQLISGTFLQPLTPLGQAISSFVHNATDGLPFYQKFLIVTLLYATVCGLIIVIPLCLIGGSLSFGFLPPFQVAISSASKQKSTEMPKNKEKENTLQNDEKRQAVEPVCKDVWNDSSLSLSAKGVTVILYEDKKIITIKDGTPGNAPESMAGGDGNLMIESPTSSKSDTKNKLEREMGNGDN